MCASNGSIQNYGDHNSISPSCRRLLLSLVRIKEYVKVSMVDGYTVNRRYFELFVHKRQGIYAR